MYIYLDMNIYNRMFDDQTQITVKLDTIAIDVIYELIGNGTCKLVWSYILEYENRNNPYPNRKERINIISQMKSDTVLGNEEIIKTAESIQKITNAKNKDALHLACAVYSGCNYFITCDNRLIRAINGNKNELKDIIREIQVLNPMDFIRREMNIDVIG
jgi:predicted nucleic acid-binding protein